MLEIADLKVFFQEPEVQQQIDALENSMFYFHKHTLLFANSLISDVKAEGTRQHEEALASIRSTIEEQSAALVATVSD